MWVHALEEARGRPLVLLYRSISFKGETFTELGVRLVTLSSSNPPAGMPHAGVIGSCTWLHPASLWVSGSELGFSYLFNKYSSLLNHLSSPKRKHSKGEKKRRGRVKVPQAQMLSNSGCLKVTCKCYLRTILPHFPTRALYFSYPPD